MLDLEISTSDYLKWTSDLHLILLALLAQESPFFFFR